MNDQKDILPFIRQLPKGWFIRKFEELLSEPLRNGIYKKKEFHGRGQKIINMGELFAYEFISNQDMKRVELNSTEIKKYLVNDGDLLFARRSLVLEGSGKCSMVVRPPEDTTFESSIIRARLNQKENNPKFYYYLFRSPLGRALMASIASQTAVSGITGSNLLNLNLPQPPLYLQNRIASILSNYDDLIENNTRRIKILEEMAQTLYNEWFVKFRFPGHEQVKMIESELGLIPEGWEVVKLGNFIETQKGFAFKSQWYQDYGVPIVKVSNFNDDSIKTKNLVCVSQEIAEQYRKHQLNRNDIIIQTVGSWASNPQSVVGKIIRVPRQAENCLLNQNAVKIIPSYPLNQTFLFYLLKTEEFKSYIIGCAQGAASQASITLDSIKAFSFLLPIDFLNSFHNFTFPIWELINNLRLKNASLSQTRDLLLPKLISGEIDVKKLDIDTVEIAA